MLRRALTQSTQPATTSPVARIAVGIGINYVNTSYQLSGCYADLRQFEKYVATTFPGTETLMFTDADTRYKAPTYNNIVSALNAIVTRTRRSPATRFLVYFYYSGHGTYTRDIEGEELCGYDNCFVTADLRIITDDEFHRIFLSGLGSNTEVIAVTDCCFSGSILDLQYMYAPGTDTMSKQNEKKLNPRVVLLSGCQELGLSYEVNGRGVMSSSLFQLLSTQPSITMKSLVKELQKTMTVGQQQPVFTCSAPDLANSTYAR